MNRILFESHEVDDDTLRLTGPRATHIRRVLRAKPGDSLLLGLLDGPLYHGRLLAIEPEVLLRLTPGPMPERPPIDLLLALPRPKVLHRLLPQIAALGVHRLFLTNAARVERCYFDTHVLEPHHLRDSLIEGLTQAGDTLLPKVRIIQRLKPFLQDELPVVSQHHNRFLLHPRDATPLLNSTLSYSRTLLAIGPEGGWVPHECDLFSSLGFHPVHIGSRILRSDTATLAALAVIHMTHPALPSPPAT